MRWQSTHWINDPPVPGEAAWLGLPAVVGMDWRRAGDEGFRIGVDGIGPIPSSAPA
jgi:hypothetical protein